jgi:hypothetical protein
MGEDLEVLKQRLSLLQSGMGAARNRIHESSSAVKY